ncbi:ExeA family protein [Lysobacter cavernae]|uniref:ExeA family protein n=1 Tax=Lysobacter cavernae TaxID=1685901 RepID=A0ABV7RQI3_9GAMM
MYLEHYGIKEPPFSITPDPRFVFLSERHRDALAHLLFGIGQGGGGGFVQLTGEVGTGKTTLCRLLLEQVPENTRVALVLNPRLTPAELLETLCEELHLDPANARGSLKALVDRLNTYLLDAYAQGLRVVLIVDEAQNLSMEALEQVRLLTNLETPTQKLLQIVLLGQPELRDLLARADMRQLAQRITARYHLTPLDAAETGEYLRHRHRVAGGTHFPFTAAAVARIHRHAGGVPRLINIIAERTLLAGYVHDQSMLDARWVDRAAREALPERPRRLTPLRIVGLAGAALALVVAVAWWWPRTATLPAASAASAVKPAVSTPAPPPATAAAAALDAEALAQRIATASSSLQPAWQRLLSLWQLPTASGDVNAASACPPVLAPGVYCLRARARLDTLVALGRPVALRLREGAHTAWAVLEGADAVNLRLQLDNSSLDVERLALERHWDGEYAALWRAPAFLAEPPRADTRGAAVDWVQARLQPRYLPAQAGPAVFDAGMREGVRRFQRARGIASDGVIGPETLMALAANDDGPRLQRERE